MKLLGFYLGYHDSNLALFDGSVSYAKSERFFHSKHHHAGLDWVESFCRDRGFYPDAVAFSDGNRNGLGACSPGTLAKPVDEFCFLGRRLPAFCIDHHYAHTLSAWPLCPLSEVDYGITIDGRGDNSFRASVVRHPGSARVQAVLQSTEYAYSRLFNRIGEHMKLGGLELDFAGKIMGAQAYGRVDEEFVDTNLTDEVARSPLKLLDEVPWRGAVPTETPGFFSFEVMSFRDWLASVHALMGLFVVRLFRAHIPVDATVVYAGGTAQNTVINEMLFQLYPHLVVPPHCYDGGISLGCLEFLRNHVGLDRFDSSGFPFWQNDPDGGYAESATIHRVAEIIAEGKIVGWFQGRGELGPRALGHRSILCDTRSHAVKDHLNRSVKRREHWRPYAASLLDRSKAAVLRAACKSPYMLRALSVSDAAMANMPGVVHIDGTCRAQTVSESDELWTFHELISTVEALTGCLGVLNTSLNAGGSPIVSTAEQALALWRESPLDALCIGNALWEK